MIELILWVIAGVFVVAVLVPLMSVGRIWFQVAAAMNEANERAKKAQESDK